MRTTIDILVRGIEETEVKPGVYSYEYTRYRKVPANIVENRRYDISDSQRINENIKSNFDFSFVFANDDTDRVNRIWYLIYKNQVYSVSKILNYPPRVRIVPDGIMSLDDLNELGVVIKDYDKNTH
nr:MAG TPA: hypothetical protein [Caudoviricetes sp.]